MTTTERGALACVGIGMTLGSHLTPLARSHIEHADVVFVAVSDGIVEQWITRMHPDVRSLQPFYAPDRPRQHTYRDMVGTMLAEVRAGRRVCGVFYGHPGVFAQAPHEAVALARKEGFPAHMEPGISSADCLYADLGLDPGDVGCQHFETTQFMLHRRVVDTSAWVCLWQVGIAGDLSGGRFDTDARRVDVLVEVLGRHYAPEHEVIVYRAATLPFQAPRIERMPLGHLPETTLGMSETLVIPPARPLEPDPGMRERLAALARPA